jgi:maleate cis-trans isomerase
MPRLNPNLAQNRVGLIIPSVNATTEPEFYWLAPPGFSFHTVRIMLRETTPEGLRRMNQDLDAALDLLASLAPTVVAYACTSGSFLDGESGLEKLLAEIGAKVDCPVVATSAALVAALRSLDVGRLALVTPYLDAVTEAERAFLEACGFQVVACGGMGLSGDAIREVAPERVRDFALGLDHPDAEAMFISCTDLRALETVTELEETLGKPVLTSNQVTLWALLRACGHASPLAGAGRLLAGS